MCIYYFVNKIRKIFRRLSIWLMVSSVVGSITILCILICFCTYIYCNWLLNDTCISCTFLFSVYNFKKYCLLTYFTKACSILYSIYFTVIQSIYSFIFNLLYFSGIKFYQNPFFFYQKWIQKTDQMMIKGISPHQAHLFLELVKKCNI